MNRKNDAVEPTARQLEILTGTLIADGHLRRNLSNTVYGKIEHGKKQYDYLLWKYLELNKQNYLFLDFVQKEDSYSLSLF